MGKPGERTKEERELVHKLAEEFMLKVSRDVREFLKELTDRGFTVGEAHHYVQHYLCFFIGRSSAFQLYGDLEDAGRLETNVQEILAHMGSREAQAAEAISRGFLSSMQQHFGLNTQWFEKQVETLVNESQLDTVPLPPKGSVNWN